ncbi:MAG: transposase [Bacteroidia bacterium]|nr:transposase [Bacteroidia bacterium]
MTIIKPLTQLREMISRSLSGQTNLSKSFQSFFIETMELMLTHTGRLNFTQMARCGRSCESRFRQNFKKPFDWLSFNKSFLEPTKGHRIAIAIDPCYISKSGKKTPGIDWFWSGCAGAIKHGLEILGLSIVDADSKDAVFLKAEQTFTAKMRGRKPKCTKGMDDPDSLTGWYLRMLTRNARQLLSICKLIVADAYFSKESFVTGVKEQGFNIISRFRDDVNLKYLYRGPRAKKRGRPQKFAGKVDLHNLDMNVFKEEYSVDGKLVYMLYTADVWAVSLGREVRVVIVDYLDSDKKKQTRKVFFSTDLTLSARDIFDIYRTRFQLEFVFRDAKQFTGLTHCQARNKEALAFAFNASLSSVNVARAYARQEGHNLSVGATKTLLHNAAMVDRFIAMSAKHANLRLNNTDFKELLFYGVRAVA